VAAAAASQLQLLFSPLNAASPVNAEKDRALALMDQIDATYGCVICRVCARVGLMMFYRYPAGSPMSNDSIENKKPSPDQAKASVSLFFVLKEL
jgi:hypothetical protein